ncbi:hypothetical protein [Fulvivirga lutimaris]|uniref:hypothetical protein n=1 Tax=Fulvivirga lutimaris TaxID=1819566 RepID=UPI0012BC71AD|nr:hypothetical protein [Fulvivirga lutimaris]MTI41213.1 hypothetical protein [Fulvivirga lutimaris]
MKSDLVKSLFKYILEAAIVAFGVVLGLYLSEQNAQSKTNENTKVALNYIVQELRANRELLIQAKEYHKKISVEFDSLSKTATAADLEQVYYTNDKFKHFKLPGWQGVGTAKVKSIIYESAKLSGVLQELNITTIQNIAEVYETLDSYKNLSKTAMDGLLNVGASTKVADVFRVFELMKYDIQSFEGFLIEHLDEKADELERTLETQSYRK